MASNSLTRLHVRGLVACAAVIPRVVWLYHWDNDLYRCHEAVMILKTKPGAVAPLAETITQLRSYRVPEMLALPVSGGDADYLAWQAQKLHNRERPETSWCFIDVSRPPAYTVDCQASVSNGLRFSHPATKA
jgi:periplasmic divalent cation tolerance protein